MTWFANRSLATKNLLAAASILAIMVGIGGFAVLKLAAVNDSTLQIANKSLPSVRLSTLIKNDIGYCRIAVLKHTLATTPEQMTKIEDERKQILIDVNAHLSQFEALINSMEERDTFAQLKSALGRYVPSADEVIAASRTDKALANHLAIGDTQKYFQEATDALNHLLDIDVKNADRARIEADAIYANARHLILMVLVFAVAIGAVQSFVLSRSIARPVLHLAEVAEAIAAGNVDQNVQVHTTEELGALANSFRRIIEVQKSLDRETREIVQAAHAGELEKRGDAAKFEGVYRELVQGFNQTLDAVIEPVTEAAQVLARVAERDLTPRVQGNYQGDHAKIKSALNLALDNLEQALSQAAVGAEQVTSAATQIANGSQSLAQGASEQASSLEEVSSSLEEMASMTRQNAENSNQGKLLAGEARGAADRGNAAMQRMAGAIDKIKSSSDATAKIVKTIDEIAFQTNLLALNAAVEAARAGEAGKGFAVVAEEVRNLAQRSAEAAKNTANMIEESVKNADGGVRITEEVAKTLGEIGEASNKVNDLVAEIAAASAEQSKGIEQINLAVNQLDKLTQQNAANSEESASAAEELNSQAQCLSQTVAQFQLRAQAAPKRLTEAPAIAAVTELTTTKRTKKRELIGATRAGSKLLPLDEDDFKGF